MNDSESRPATRGQRRGFFWQDVYAAWLMLRCLACPEEGIEAIEVEAGGAPHIDDIIVHRRDRIEFLQLKHTDDPSGTLTGSSLFSAAKNEKPLLEKLFIGWRRVGNRSQPRSVVVQLVTNARASTAKSNMLIAPADFEPQILTAARQRGERWNPTGELRGIVNELKKITGARSRTELLRFLASLQLRTEEPSVDDLMTRCGLLLQQLLRPRERLETEVRAWIAQVTELATNSSKARVLFRGDLDRELRTAVSAPARRVEHRLALPENHVERGEIATRILAEADTIGSGYILVCGPPGCGKTTLATWLSDQHSDRVAVRYHVFDPSRSSTLERALRARGYEFVANLLDVLAQRFPSSMAMWHTTPEATADAVDALWQSLAKIRTDVTQLVVVDGIDHVLRADLTQVEQLFCALRREVPAGIVFVLFGQPDWPYPRWLTEAKRVEVPPFTLEQTTTLTCARLGWSTADDDAIVVCAQLQDVTAGNPLSLFYNLAAVESIGSPAEVAEALPRLTLFRNSPHSTYAQLIDDLTELLSVSSRSLRRDLLAFIAVAVAKITADRLLLAFEGDLTHRQACDVLVELRPVLTEDGAGGFTLFHDDFRRFAEQQTSPAELVEAHRRHARALAQNWAGVELSAWCEHLWLGGLDDVLADLPRKLPLEKWLARAPGDAVVKMHQLAAAAALRRGDEVAILRNALGCMRVTEVVQPPYSEDGEPPAWLGLRGWTFVTAPREEDHNTLRLRARAITLAALDESGDLSLAREVVRRFALSDSQEQAVAEEHEVAFREYLDAKARWLLRCGEFELLAAALGSGGAFAQSCEKAVDAVLVTSQDPDLIVTVAEALAGISTRLDHDFVASCLRQTLRGDDAEARRLALILQRRFCDSPEELRRDIEVLCVVLGVSSSCSMDLAGAPVFTLRGEEHLDYLALREFFFHGFMTAQVGSSVDFSACIFPPHWFERPFEVETERPPALLAWQTGAICGLLARRAALVSLKDLRVVLTPLAQGGEGGDYVARHAITRSAQMLLPLLARSVRCSPGLMAVFLEVVRPLAERYVVYPSPRTIGLLESLWYLEPELWKRIAADVPSREVLPGSDGFERRDWFAYWEDRAPLRGVHLPERATELRGVASLGVLRKSYPSTLAHSLLPAAALAAPHHAEQRVRRFVDLLIQLRSDPEGDRSAIHHLPGALATALAICPDLFYREFVRATHEHGIDEPFDDLVASIGVQWLDAPHCDANEQELLALWYCVTACPGSFSARSHGAALGERLIARLRGLGAGSAADTVTVWLECLAEVPRAEEPGKSESAKPAGTESLTSKAQDFSLRSFNWMWGHLEQERLRIFLRDTGDIGWRELTMHLADRVATEPRLAHELQYLAEGLPIVREVADPDAALEVALDDLAERVRWQRPAAERTTNGRVVHSRSEAFVALTARGLVVSETETVRRTIRALAAMARQPLLAPLVDAEMRSVLVAGDFRSIAFALMVLRCVTPVSSETLLEVQRLTEHPDAWCRWLSCSMLGRAPAWPSTRAVLADALLVASTRRESVGVDRVSISDDVLVRDNFANRIAALTGAPSVELHAALRTEELLSEPLVTKPSGWHQRPWGSGLFSEGRATAAARRVICAVASSVPESVRPVLIATATGTDAWLVTCPPSVPPPDSWVELCIAAVDYTDSHEETLLRSLGLVEKADWQQLERLGNDEAAQECCSALLPDAPRYYAWVAEDWAEVEPPLMRLRPVQSLAFLNNLFCEMDRASFRLVPNWGHALFADLKYEVAARPQWVQADGTPVLVATFCERNTAARPEGGLYVRPSWSAGWFADPLWLRTVIPSDMRLVRFWRSARGRRRRTDSPGSRSSAQADTYGAELVDW